MKPKLVILFSVIVLIPLGLLAWLGIRMNQDEFRKSAAHLRKLHTEKLDEWSNRVGETMDELERSLLASTESFTLDHEAIRTYVRTTPGIGQMMVVDQNQGIRHPPKNLTQTESEFLQRIFPYLQQYPSLHPPMESPGDLPEYGWNHWYYGSGAQFLFWRRLSSGYTVGIEVPRPVMLSRVIDVLPEEASSSAYQLLDGGGNNMYRWGSYSGEVAVASLTLQTPLNIWTLEAFGARPPTSGLASVAPTLIGIAIVIVITA
ncbi:MAG: hypothetical protein AAF492_18540, partial [Verrucomicrobiota bacterium]